MISSNKYLESDFKKKLLEMLLGQEQSGLLRARYG